MKSLKKTLITILCLCYVFFLYGCSSEGGGVKPVKDFDYSGESDYEFSQTTTDDFPDTPDTPVNNNNANNGSSSKNGNKTPDSGTSSQSVPDDDYKETINSGALLKDPLFSAGYRADWQLGLGYTGDARFRKGEITSYRNISPRTINIVPSGTDRGKYWEILTEDHLNKYLYTKEFEFDGGTEGFNATNGGISAEKSSLYLNTNSDGAYIESPALSMSTNENNLIRVRLRNPTGSKALKLMFITNTDTSWNDTKSVNVNMTAGNTSSRAVSYGFNMYQNDNWKGTITKIRLVFGAGSATKTTDKLKMFEIEYINFASALVERYWDNKLNVNPIDVVNNNNLLKVTKYNMQKKDYQNYKMAEVTTNKNGSLTMWNNSANHPQISKNVYYNNPDMECWPALYLFQNFKTQVPLSSFEKVQVSFDIVLEKVKHTPSGREGRVISDTNGFGDVTLNDEAGLTVQIFYRNKFDQSKMFYTMLRLYSSEGTYFQHMDGDYFGAVFYWPEQSSATGMEYGEFPLTIGKKAKVSFDAKALLAKGMEIAMDNPRFAELSSSVNDYNIDGFYLGWEYLGDFETQFTVSNLKATGAEKITPIREFTFDNNSSEGFKPSNINAVLQSFDGVTHLRFAEATELISPSGLKLDANKAKLLKFRVTSDASKKFINGQFAWRREGDSEWQPMRKAQSGGSEPIWYFVPLKFKFFGSERKDFGEYILNLQGDPQWSGTIDQFKFIFQPETPGRVSRISFDKIWFDSPYADSIYNPYK